MWKQTQTDSQRDITNSALLLRQTNNHTVQITNTYYKYKTTNYTGRNANIRYLLW